jgi:hypothetical protein
MAKMKQLNAVIKGKTDALHRICAAMGDAKINIDGMMATGEVLRLLVDDLDKASQVLDSMGVHNAVEEVLGIELAHKPGTVADVIHRLASRGIKIRYAYAAGTPDSQRAFFILSVTDMTEAMEALR